MDKERLAKLLEEVVQRDFNETVEASYDKNSDVIDLGVYQMNYKFYFNSNKIVKMGFEESVTLQKWLDLVKENYIIDESNRHIFKNYNNALTINWYSSCVIPSILQGGSMKFVIDRIKNSEYEEELKMFTDIINNYLDKYKEMSKKILPLCDELQYTFKQQYGK